MQMSLTFKQSNKYIHSIGRESSVYGCFMKIAYMLNGFTCVVSGFAMLLKNNIIMLLWEDKLKAKFQSKSIM